MLNEQQQKQLEEVRERLDALVESYCDWNFRCKQGIDKAELLSQILSDPDILIKEKDQRKPGNPVKYHDEYYLYRRAQEDMIEAKFVKAFSATQRGSDET